MECLARPVVLSCQVMMLTWTCAHQSVGVVDMAVRMWQNMSFLVNLMLVSPFVTCAVFLMVL